MDHIRGLTDFLRDNPTQYHVTASQARTLEKEGFVRLSESEKWDLHSGGKYYVTRNGSAMMAFRMPGSMPRGFMVMASHTDFPYLKIKPGGEITTPEGYKKLNVEVYGSAIYYSWLDRPLSVAGRIYVRTADGTRMMLVNVPRDLALIPSVPIHMNREINSGVRFDPQKDLLPLWGIGESETLTDVVAAEAGVRAEDILSMELCLYNRTPPVRWGASGEFLSAQKLDDSECAYCSLAGFLESTPSSSSIAIHALFDNEEVGSATKQGAASTLLRDTLERISISLGADKEDMLVMLSNSFMLSADNAHGVNPNHPELSDPVNRPVPGGGVVIKFAGSQRYATDGTSEALFRLLCEKGDVKSQIFTNRSDLPGGSTLGNISSLHAAMMTADVGIAQLAMHSTYETCAVSDVGEMIKLATALFSSSVEKDPEGGLILK
ncbi:MAG: M18 family aminopeptidase [Eubacteriaceae bacterium]|nr:M18 family aminopeptidase [Eubacteriaceae bacterium]